MPSDPAHTRPAHAAASLAELVCAKLCHDLSSPLGTLTALLGMAGGDTESLAVAQDAARDLQRRLRLQNAAWGAAAGPADAAGLSELLAGAPAAQRVRFDLDGTDPALTLPAGLVPLVLNAALLAADALPRGGTVAVAASADQVVAVPSSPRAAAWPEEVLAALAGGTWAEALALGPRRAVAALLLAQADALGWHVQFGLPGGGALPALVLTAP